MDHCSYWCCGIPLAAYLAFKQGMGLEGLWWGLLVINTLQASLPGPPVHGTAASRAKSGLCRLWHCGCTCYTPGFGAGVLADTVAVDEISRGSHLPACATPGMQGCIMLALAYFFDFEAQAERAAALLQQAAARSAEVDVPNPLLEPLLPGAGAAAASTRAARRRKPAGRERQASLDVEGIKRRLSLAMLLLLTDGAHTRRSRLPNTRGRGYKAADSGATSA